MATFFIEKYSKINPIFVKIKLIIFGSSQIYFRAAPKFEAPNESKYNWLNDAILLVKVFRVAEVMLRLKFGKFYRKFKKKENEKF